ncbi:HAD family hydrolase [Sulfurimonas sp. SAG-AH-194-I05]|nr:HAD family hydrolase [Sulfurimonas sp. SAG-AH-194-I05]MDF1874157.1 HAD family hydrolase [Sulfurimonas sp. SAG-AH-194-I05]
MIILFDLDGTLIDSTDAIVSTFHYSFDAHQHKHPTDEAITSLIGYPLDIMYERLGIDKDKIWDFVATYKEEYRKIATQKTELLACAKEAIAMAKGIATLGIVTTKTGSYSQILMEHFALMEYFEVLIGREHVQNPKPHAEPILKALEALKSDDKDIWMIGDTKLDLLCAKNANVKSIGVLSGYGEKVTLDKYTDIVVNDALEAVEFLQKRISKIKITFSNSTKTN